MRNDREVVMTSQWKQVHIYIYIHVTTSSKIGTGHAGYEERLASWSSWWGFCSINTSAHGCLYLILSSGPFRWLCNGAKGLYPMHLQTSSCQEAAESQNFQRCCSAWTSHVGLFALVSGCTQLSARQQSNSPPVCRTCS